MLNIIVRKSIEGHEFKNMMMKKDGVRLPIPGLYLVQIYIILCQSVTNIVYGYKLIFKFIVNYKHLFSVFHV